MDIGEAIPIGAHLAVARLGYVHHGIYVGGGRVVHYAGLSSLRRRGPVEEVSLEQFRRGYPLRLCHDSRSPYRGAVVAARARSRLGEDDYRVLSNNCEHFCEWCIYGCERSSRGRALAAPLRWLALLLAPERRAPLVMQ